MVVYSSLNDPKLLTALQSGQVGVLPTDTIYGLVADAHNQQAVAQLYRLKHREQKPGTVIAATIEQLIALGVPARYLKAVAHLWPNPISIELPLPDSLDYLHQGTHRQAFRVVADKTVRQLLEQTGPLVTSSANQPGEPPATNLQTAQAYFTDQVDFYVDGEDLQDRKPSTIIRVIDDAIEIVRLGAVKIDETGHITKP